MPETLVLDTHVWVWLVAGEAKLGDKTLARIGQAARRGEALVAAISVWEVAMLEARRHLVLTKPVLQWVQDALTAPGLSLAPLSPEIAVDACRLPADPGGDPADRMIVATARQNGATLVTRDRRILDYGQQGHVATLAA
jgi:PIN domain nuclease of toxin-antitoxin system